MKPLNEKQLAFAREYFACKHQAQAAAAAGYKGTHKSLQKIGSKLCRDDRVKAELARLRKDSEDTLIVTKKESLRYLSRALRLSLEDICDDHGEFDWQKAKKAGALDLIERYEVEPQSYQGVILANKIKVRLVGKIESNAQLRAELGWDEPIRQHVELEKKTELSRLSVKELLARAKAAEAKLTKGKPA